MGLFRWEVIFVLAPVSVHLHCDDDVQNGREEEPPQDERVLDLRHCERDRPTLVGEPPNDIKARLR